MPAGAKPGERRGGRAKGAANLKTREIADKAALEGITPLEYMLSILSDERQETDKRFEAAKAAAPYIHPRLANVEANIEGKVGLTVEIVRFSDVQG